MGLIVRFATGVPPLEAAMLRSKGGAYRDYQARVGALLPWRKA
jgi:steroid 5-alpha reductase family enzyme